MIERVAATEETVALIGRMDAVRAGDGRTAAEWATSGLDEVLSIRVEAQAISDEASRLSREQKLAFAFGIVRTRDQSKLAWLSTITDDPGIEDLAFYVDWEPVRPETTALVEFEMRIRLRPAPITLVRVRGVVS